MDDNPAPPPSAQLALRRRPVQARSRETLRRIFDAMLVVIERDGVAGLSSDRIAEVAGLSVGAVYKFFPNKQSILAALAEEWMEKRAASFAEICEMEPDAHPYDRVARWFVYFTQTPAHHVLTVWRVLSYYPELRELDRANKAQSADLLFREFRRHGSPLDDDALRRAARFVNETGSALLLQILSAPESRRAELLDWALQCMRTAVGIALGDRPEETS